MKTILTISAIRPDVIRLAALIKKLDADPNYNHIYLHTGQAYDKDRFDIFLDDMEVRRPDIILSSGAPGRLAWEQIYECGKQILEAIYNMLVKPDIVLYLGDSNSAMSAVALKRAGFRVGRIEAFMRAYPSIQDMSASGLCPLPEELNRKIADSVSDLLFTYHAHYMMHGILENIPADRITIVGNTIVEPIRKYADLTHIGLKNKILVDIHREENIVDPVRLKFILDGLRLYGKHFSLPIEMLDFGRTTQTIKDHNLDISGITMVPLMGFHDYVRAQQDSLFIVSDSGSALEECPLLKIPIICFRTITERPEAFISANNAFLLQANYESFNESIEWINKYDSSNVDISWLGDGKTSEHIVNFLKETDGKYW